MFANSYPFFCTYIYSLIKGITCANQIASIGYLCWNRGFIPLVREARQFNWAYSLGNVRQTKSTCHSRAGTITSLAASISRLHFCHLSHGKGDGFFLFCFVFQCIAKLFLLYKRSEQ